MEKQEGEYEADGDEAGAKFNMALDSLKRLGEIFRDIKALYSINYVFDGSRLRLKVYLVQQFFIQASPLLPIEVVAKYKEEILKFEVIQLKKHTQSSVSLTRKFTRTVLFYDRNLDIRLNEILIELQQELQKKKYFMPPAEEDGMF